MGFPIESESNASAAALYHYWRKHAQSVLVRNATLGQQVCVMPLTKTPFKVKIRQYCVGLKTSHLGAKAHIRNTDNTNPKMRVFCVVLIKMHLHANSKHDRSFRKEPLLLTFPININNPPPGSLLKDGVSIFTFTHHTSDITITIVIVLHLLWSLSNVPTHTLRDASCC